MTPFMAIFWNGWLTIIFFPIALWLIMAMNFKLIFPKLLQNRMIAWLILSRKVWIYKNKSFIWSRNCHVLYTRCPKKNVLLSQRKPSHNTHKRTFLDAIAIAYNSKYRIRRHNSYILLFLFFWCILNRTKDIFCLIIK